MRADSLRQMAGPYPPSLSRRSFVAALAGIAAAGCALDLPNGGVAPRKAYVKDILPLWRNVFLSAGEVIDLAPRMIYSDGSTEPLRRAATFRSSDPTVAVVNPAGILRGLQPGRTHLTLHADGYNSTVHVTVGSTAVAHFSRRGEVLERYEAGRSIFVRTLFQMDPSELRRSAALATRARVARINALTTGFYLNPVHSPTVTEFARWQAPWLQYWTEIQRVADEYNFSLVLTGDDIARTPRELSGSISGSWSGDALELAFKTVRDSRRVICVEMVDEVDYFWGDTPTPRDGRWRAKVPSIPDGAFTTVMSYINRVAGRPPLSWPVSGSAGPEVARNWMGHPTFSDYASHYWADASTSRDATEGVSALPRILQRMESAISPRLESLPAGRPGLMLTSISGTYFTKLAPGSKFTAGKDRVLAPGVHPIVCAAEIMYGALAGMAGVRSYQFDSSRTRKEREDAPVGAHGVQTGSEPFDVGSDRWQAMASAFSVIEGLEAEILQPQINSPYFGRSVVTSARQSDAGRLLMAVSFSAIPETVSADLSPFLYDEGGTTRYRLHGATVSVETGPTIRQEMVTFRPGEAVLWLFRPPKAWPTVNPPTVRFVEPVPDAVGEGHVGIHVLAAHPEAVTRVDLFVDEHMLTSFRSAPFAVKWNARTVTPGWHTISAVAHSRAASSEARTAIHIGQM